jgi:hypothetical protein
MIREQIGSGADIELGKFSLTFVVVLRGAGRHST